MKLKIYVKVLKRFTTNLHCEASPNQFSNDFVDVERLFLSLSIRPEVLSPINRQSPISSPPILTSCSRVFDLSSFKSALKSQQHLSLILKCILT